MAQPAPEADNISRLTGCEIELRREGVALIDHAHQTLGATSFPGSSTVAHAALLWLTALLELNQLAATPDEPDDDTADLRIEFVVAAETAAATWATMLDDYSARLSQDAREQPERFQADVADLLRQFRLVVPHPEGLAVTAFANRFRARPALVDDDPVEAAQQRMF